MKAVFDVEEMVQDWSPPFKKNKSTKEMAVAGGESFSTLEKTGEFVFKLLKLEGERALVEYNPQFTLKGYENPGTKQIWINVGEEKAFTFLWGEKGTTKKLVLKRIEPDGEPQTSDNS